MIRSPKFKVCRRVGDAIFGKCQTPKFSATKSEGKGKTGKRRKGASEYGAQLKEKQKIRLSYGVSEEQFRGYINKAVEGKGNPIQNLRELLELRLDNIVYRTGIAGSREMARQMVSHGHILVNGKKNTIPSTFTRVGSKISVRAASSEKAPFIVKEGARTPKLLEWLAPLEGKLEFIVKSLPGVKEADTTLSFGAVVEYYSRV